MGTISVSTVNIHVSNVDNDRRGCDLINGNWIYNYLFN
jgi:hypothetical protein